jgi:hypothetical protein
VYAGALPAVRVTVCRLHAGPAELARRISRRGLGLSWPQPGDPLIGQPEAHLRLVAAEAAAQAEALERSGLGDLRIDTDGRTVAEIADLIARRWYGTSGQGPPLTDPGRYQGYLLVRRAARTETVEASGH